MYFLSVEQSKRKKQAITECVLKKKQVFLKVAE